MNKAAVLGIGAMALVLALALAEGDSHAMPPPGVLPDGAPTNWRRMLDSELVPSEVAYAVAMLNGNPPTSEEIHSTANGWRRWLREKSGGRTYVTVWRPSSDPTPSNSGGLPAIGGNGDSGGNVAG